MQKVITLMKRYSFTTWVLLCLGLIYIASALLSNEIQTWVYIATSAVGVMLWQIWAFRTQKIKVHRPSGVLGHSIFGVAVFTVLIMLASILELSEGTSAGISVELVILVGAVTCLVIGQESVRNLQIDILFILKGLLHGSSVILLMRLLGLFNWSWFEGLLRILSDDAYSMGMLCIMAGILATGFYCNEKNVTKERVYLVEMLLSFVVLGIGNNSLCLHIMFFLLLYLLAEIYPKKEYVQRSGQALFYFLFVISNIPILTEYTTIFHGLDKKYNMQNSIVLDLLICMLGAVFIYFMDKTEELTKEEAEDILNRMQYGLFCFMIGILLFLGVALIGAETVQKLPDGFFVEIFQDEVKTLSSAFKKQWKNTIFMGGLKRYGLVGFIYSIYLMILTYRQEYIGVWHCNKRKIGLRMLVIFQGVAIVFMPVKMWSFGIYILLVAYLLRGGLSTPIKKKGLEELTGVEGK